MPKRNDNFLIDDIHEAGSKILRYTANYTFPDFTADERTVDAVIRNFEIIGEAASRLSEQLQQLHPSVPWREIISYRNLLIHEYFGVSLKVVWNIIQDDLPLLMKTIKSVKESF
jgi:uncharacterized protein with HEPN domain